MSSPLLILSGEKRGVKMLGPRFRMVSYTRSLREKSPLKQLMQSVFMDELFGFATRIKYGHEPFKGGIYTLRKTRLRQTVPYLSSLAASSERVSHC